MSAFTKTDMGSGLVRWDHKTERAVIAFYPAATNASGRDVFFAYRNGRHAASRDGHPTLLQAVRAVRAA